MGTAVREGLVDCLLGTKRNTTPNKWECYLRMDRKMVLPGLFQRKALELGQDWQQMVRLCRASIEEDLWPLGLLAFESVAGKNPFCPNCTPGQLNGSVAYQDDESGKPLGWMDTKLRVGGLVGSAATR